MVITKIRIDGVDYGAAASLMTRDALWNNRSVKLLRMAVSLGTLQTLFPAGGKISWATVEEYTEAIPQTDADGNAILDDEGQPVYENVTRERVTDQSLWCVCGPITDNRDGTYTVKMGKELDSELRAARDEAEAALEILMEGAG